MRKQVFNITGMSCAACQANITKNIEKLDGIKNTQVNLITNKMSVEFDEDKVSEEKIINTVISIGYGASLESASDNVNPVYNKINEKDKTRKIKLVISIILLFPLMYLAMGHMIGLPMPKLFTAEENILISPFTQFLITMVVVLLNKHFYISGFKALVKKSPNMDTLVSIGSGAALVYGIVSLYIMMNAQGSGDTNTLHHYAHNLYFESSAMILTLVSLGKYLEARSKSKTSDAISKLINLAPKTATVIRNSETKVISVDNIIEGDVIIVKPGDIIPVDGNITEGYGNVDQSAITGESVPVEKNTGDSVISATVNKNGSFKMIATRVGKNTTLSQIIKLVEEAGSSKAPIARLADKVSGIFVPVVIGISLITMIIWLLLGYDFEFVLNLSISVLVISCPCALGLATPVAIMVGTGKAAEHGILIKSAESLEQLKSIDTIIFDKTGTLTQGKPSVTDVIIIDSNLNEKDLLKYAAIAEKGSNHPFAKAITEKAGNLPDIEADNFKMIPGGGIEADINGIHWTGGNLDFAKTIAPIEDNITDKVFALSNEGKTPLLFTKDGKIAGLIAVADTIRPEAPSVIKDFNKLGIKTIMLTGDNKLTAKKIGEHLGITDIISDVLPGDKEAHVRELQNSGKIVAMVGDGINDAPALTRAHIGIAIGKGTDIAIESADIVLIKDSLEDILTAVKLSKKVIRNIKTNLFWAFFYNIIGIPLAAGVFYPAFGLLLSPMIGSLAMSLSSLFVVSNALRLRYFEKNKKKGSDNMKKVLTINGMMCNHCKATVEKVLSQIDGVSSCEVDLGKKTATVGLTKEVDDNLLMEVIKEAGFEPVSFK
ncbi:MAG: heavy metal translocating P-type ATPase [Ruminococcaceae bacterium]|nr:heavy metal translocating P-type ATPase [Oscillospiraceae bacterium]